MMKAQRIAEMNNLDTFKPSLPTTELSIALDEILADIKDTLVRKNLDYGNSFEEQYKEYGLTSYLIRDDDKTRRLKNLQGKQAFVADESVMDTVKDKAGYAVLMYWLLLKEQTEANIQRAVDMA